jgi:glycosyltransferase involved in cell wall biosynthesis
MVIQRLRTADHVVAVSDYIRGQAIDHGVSPDNVTTIRNPIRRFEPRDPAAVEAVRSHRGIAPDAFVYGMVGRLDPGKGHLDAIAAFDRLAADDPEVWLMIVGTGRHESRIQAAARRSVAADRIVFLGQRPDVADILGSLDAFVHPASKDPCPLAVLEAMAAGLPIVAYADGGVPELIVNAESGLLAPRGDVIDLSGLMGLLRRDHELASSLGEAAAVRATTEFTPERAGAEFGDIVTSVAATARR